MQRQRHNHRAFQALQHEQLRGHVSWPLRCLQGLLGGWVLLCFGLLALAPACSDDNKNDENAEGSRCDFRGVCVISYANPAVLGTRESTRRCLLRKEPGRRCGECWDHKFDEEKRLLEKTCVVCKLCNNDFECIESADCGKETPFCQEGSCVVCRGNSDCEGEKKFCENGKCLTCRKDSDCTKEESPQCEDGTCVACSCAEKDKKTPYCRKDELTREVTCVACLEDKQCKAPTPRCDAKTNQCISACRKDVDCRAGEFCEEGSCLSCRSHSDCKDAKKPRCFQGSCQCVDDQDCPKNFPRCSEQACIQCTKASDCPKGFPRCVEGECLLALCKDETDCTASGYRNCRAFGQSTVCVGCIKDADCASGQSCDLTSFRCN